MNHRHCNRAIALVIGIAAALATALERRIGGRT